MRELERHGHQVTLRSAKSEGDEDRPAAPVPLTSRDMQGYDVVLAQRFNTNRGLETWRRARTPASRLVYDADDDVFNVSPQNWQAYHLYSQPDVRDAVEHSAEVSDLITVTTPYLADVMREHSGNPNIAILPNYLPRLALDTERVPRDRPAVGWQGGASHGDDMGLVAAPLRRFLRRFPGWDVRLIGTDFRQTLKAGDRATYGGWTRIYEDPAGFYASLDYDIGLAPLAGHAFDLGKSCVKALEHAARGIPTIATDCEVYRAFVRHGENGFLVKREHEWLSYLSELARDEGLRRAMGEQARRDARDWLIEDHYQEWEQAYQGLFPGRSFAV